MYDRISFILKTLNQNKNTKIKQIEKNNTTRTDNMKT